MSEATWQSASPKTCGFRRTFCKKRNILENGLPHQSADWFAMTGYFERLPHHLSGLVRNDRFFDSLKKHTSTEVCFLYVRN